MGLGEAKSRMNGSVSSNPQTAGYFVPKRSTSPTEPWTLSCLKLRNRDIR